jgi:signal transduction histidine kinase
LTLRALLENALKFGPVGVEVILDAEILPDRVMLTVSDNGPGIPRDELPKVFEKFYQIDPAQSGQIRGFGLGLFYARRFALDHGGSLQLDSEPGRGTRATLTLPR